MINVESVLRVSDNSGATIVKCIKNIKVASRVGAIPGQIVIIVVQKSIFKKHIVKKSKIIMKGKICKALIIRSVKGLKRWGNFFVKCFTNSIVLLNEYNLPYATRIFGPIFREVRENPKYSKILSLAVITL